MKKLRTNKSRNNLCGYYEKTPEEMEEIIYKLSTKDIKFLKEIYGEKLDGDISKGSLSQENRIKLNAILGRINKILSNGQIRTNKSRNNLCRYYEKTPEEMEEIIYKLSTKDINFLKEIYGEKLDGDIFKGSLSKENRIKLSAVLGRINKLLTTEIYCSNESVLKDEISLVKQLSISKIGLSESSSSQFEKMNKNDYEELKKILSIKNSKKVLSIEESLILILLFGFHKEKSFSIDDISRFLGEDPKIILEIEKRGIITLKEEINCIFNEVIKNKHNQKSLVLKNDD